MLAAEPAQIIMPGNRKLTEVCFLCMPKLIKQTRFNNYILQKKCFLFAIYYAMIV